MVYNKKTKQFCPEGRMRHMVVPQTFDSPSIYVRKYQSVNIFYQSINIFLNIDQQLNSIKQDR